MRISSMLAAMIFAPALALTACTGGAGAKTSPTKTAPLVGIVEEKEYKAAVYAREKVPIRERRCSRDKKTGSQKCSRVTTGFEMKNVKKQDPCYQLEIRTRSGDEYEICDIRAYGILDKGDPYDASKAYGRSDF